MPKITLKEKIIFHYAKKLNYLADTDIHEYYSKEIDCNSFILGHSRLSSYQKHVIRLLFVMRCLLKIAEQRKMITEEQSRNLQKNQLSVIINQRSWQLDISVARMFTLDIVGGVCKLLEDNTVFTKQDTAFLKNLFQQYINTLGTNNATITPSQIKRQQREQQILANEFTIDQKNMDLLSPHAQTIQIIDKVMSTPVEKEKTFIFPNLEKVVKAPLRVQLEDNLDMPNDLNHYQIIKLVAKGSMGEIYLAKDTKQNRKVAIKILANDLADGVTSRFMQEAEVLSCLNHTNIINMYEFSFAHAINQYYIAMEFAPGKNVKEILNELTVIDAVDSLNIMSDVVEALRYSLTRRIIHRDIKPANIIITSDEGNVKLTDFGIGKILNQNGNTKTGEVMGTPYYISPEQIIDTRSVDHKTDIYSIGATLYRMISGKAPYSQHKGLHNIMRAKINEDSIPLSDVANVSKSISDLVARAMARDPQKRYQTFSQMQRDIQGILQQYSRM
ncbi:serine/threonine protein kinase [Candidatus Uabimicrobium sp. HlEnr_7]|uniref:serine/threonine protein kinase n=1 Tax=Candidatus Uabimicrobium helgolandensis TaxID=3095367 RepID=UPI003556051B